MIERIPLHNRAGEVVGHAIVDAADAVEVGHYRWHMSDGYAQRRAGDGHVYMHRQILGLKPGDPMTDHRNRDKLDNRRANLRTATNAESQQNLPAYGGSISRFRGVTWSRRDRQWRAGVKIGGKQVNLGAFDSETDAARVAEAYRREHMPFAEPDPALLALDQTEGEGTHEDGI